MRRRKPLRYIIQSEINVIPFLDVLLVLLMIFMMIPSKLIHNFEVNLPNTTGTKNFIEDNKNSIVIEITKNELYNLLYDRKHIKNINLDQLFSEIYYNKLHLNTDILFLLAASKDTKYNEIIQILNLLNHIGIHSVGMITEPSARIFKKMIKND